MGQAWRWAATSPSAETYLRGGVRHGIRKKTGRDRPEPTPGLFKKECIADVLWLASSSRARSAEVAFARWANVFVSDASLVMRMDDGWR